jgi:hypothetical protein
MKTAKFKFWYIVRVWVKITKTREKIRYLHLTGIGVHIVIMSTRVLSSVIIFLQVYYLDKTKNSVLVTRFSSNVLKKYHRAQQSLEDLSIADIKSISTLSKISSSHGAKYED